MAQLSVLQPATLDSFGKLLLPSSEAPGVVQGSLMRGVAKAVYRGSLALGQEMRAAEGDPCNEPVACKRKVANPTRAGAAV
jgi:hypothetical protein